MPKQTILATVRDRTLGKPGPGPIYTCSKLTATERRDGAGNFRAEFPATDAMLARVRVKEVYLEFTVGGKFFFLGLVERVTRVMDRKGRQTLIVTGRDQLGALAENTIGELALEWAFNAPILIIGAGNVPNQTFSLSSDGLSVTAYPFTKQFAGESALSALVTLSEDIGEHFRAPKGPTLEVVWLGTATAAAPVRLVAAGGPRLHENPDIAVIEQVESDQNAERLVNRIYAYGAGFGAARLTLADATISMPTDFSMNTAASYIQHDGQQALPLLLMAQQKTWSHIGAEAGQIYDIAVETTALTGATLIVVETIAIPIPAGTLLDLNGGGVNFVELSANVAIGANVLNVVATTFDVLDTDELRYIPASASTAAANQLAYAALQHLQRLSDPERMVAYKLTVRGLPDDVAVGQVIPVLAQAPGFAIDDDLIILEITRTVTAAGRMPATVRVVPVDWFEMSDAAVVATAIEQLENLQRQGQPVDYDQLVNVPALAAHSTSHKHGGSDEVATATPAANAIVKADADGKIGAGWIDDADINLDNVTEGTTNKFFDATEQSKLAGIEALADVTDATNIASSITGVSTDDTIVDADVWGYLTGGALVKTAWSNIKAVLKTYFDTLYNLYVHPNHTGEVTSVADGATTIASNAVVTAKIANNNVTLAKIAQIATARILGRITAATGNVEELTAANVRSIINVADGANAYVHPNHSGDVTSVADGATTIGALKVQTGMVAASAITYAKIQNVSATDKLLGRSTAGAGVIEEIALTAYARTLIDDINAAAARTTLELGTIATLNAVDFVDLTTAQDVGGIKKFTSNIVFSPGSTQDYTWSDDGAGVLTLTSSAAGGSNTIRLYTADGDGTDIVSLQLWGKGNAGDVSNRERLIIQYALTSMEIFSEAQGTGTLRPLILYTEGNTNQLYLATDGKIGFNTNTPSHRSHVKDSANIYQTKIQANSVTADAWGGIGFSVSTDDAGSVTAAIRAIRKASSTDIDLDFRGNADTVSLMYLDSSAAAAGFGTSAPTGKVSIQAGTSTGHANAGGVLYVSTATVGNVGTGEDDLASYSVPANTLSANGMSLCVEASGSWSTASELKTLRLRFGTAGTNLVMSYALNTATAFKWVLRARIVRTGAATQIAHVTLFGATAVSAGVSVVDVLTLDQTLSGAVTLKVTGEATTTNAIVLNSFIVDWDDNHA